MWRGGTHYSSAPVNRSNVCLFVLLFLCCSNVRAAKLSIGMVYTNRIRNGNRLPTHLTPIRLQNHFLAGSVLLTSEIMIRSQCTNAKNGRNYLGVATDSHGPYHFSDTLYYIGMGEKCAGNLRMNGLNTHSKMAPTTRIYMKQVILLQHHQSCYE